MDGVCCSENLRCGVGRTAGQSQTSIEGGLVQRVVGGVSGLAGAGDLSGGVGDLRGGIGDFRAGVIGLNGGDSVLGGGNTGVIGAISDSALTADVPRSGRVSTRKTVRFIGPMAGGTRSVFRQSGGSARTILADSIGRAVGGTIIGTSKMGDSTRGKLQRLLKYFKPISPLVHFRTEILNLTAVAGVGSSPTRVTCGTSQVLLAGVSDGFLGVLPRFAPPTDWLVSI